MHRGSLFALMFTACAAEPPPAPRPITAQPRPAVVAPAPEPAPGVLRRGDVVAVVDQGLGSFLQRVAVEPRFSEGKFHGWSILALEPVGYWAGVDLRVGDVVTRVNGMPLERPTEAHAAFESLKTADRLVVTFVRAGEPRELRFDIAPRRAKQSAAGGG